MSLLVTDNRLVNVNISVQQCTVIQFFLMMNYFKLQRAQNNLARVVCQCRGRSDARPLLRSLHWLPIRQRIEYKIALVTYNWHWRLRTCRTSPTCWRSKSLHVQYVLLMRHTSSCREHGLNLRSELSQSQLPSSGIHCQLLFVTVKLFWPLKHI